VTLVIAAFVPLAAGLYLLTTTGWTLLERTFLGRAVTPAPSSTAVPAAPVFDRRLTGLLRGSGGLMRRPGSRRTG
jgi:hypothetical protein